MPIHRRSFLAGGSGLSWDFSSDYDYLDSPEIRRALKTSTQDGAKPLDVLFYDVCLMGMLEVADQVQEYAGYFVSSQNIGWAPVGPQGRYVRTVQGITPATTPRAMAQLLVQSYAASLPPNEHPFTVSAVDLGVLPALVGAVDQLGKAINATLAGPNPPLALLHSAYASAQKTDYDSDFAIEPATDGFVDLYDFAGRASTAYAAYPPVKAAAGGVTAALEQALVAEQHRSGSPWMALDRYWDLDGVHGLSIFLPLGEDLLFDLQGVQAPDPAALLHLRDVYSSDQLRFVAATSWRGLIERYYELAAAGVPTETADGPADGLLPPDVTPPQTAVTVMGRQSLGQGLSLAWSADDSQSGVAGAALWVRQKGGDWLDTSLAQSGAAGQFHYPQILACGSSLAARAADAAGNLEPLEHGANLAVVQRDCFVFIPWMGR